jgi:aspartyl-tRNA(Asn)/glutamyl-tRNA(Gln) amidotransferase subunit B
MLHEFVHVVESGVVSGPAAKTVFEEMYRTGKPASTVIEEQGLTQISSSDELAGIAARVIEANPKPVADYRGGKETALKALVGLLMRETRGRANPQLAEQLLRDQLDS